MKSIKSSGSAVCPDGCEPFDAEFWTLIGADEDESLKQALLGGELNLVRCPECGKFFYHDRDIIYFDPPAQLLAFVAPNAGKKDFDKVKAKMQADFKLLKENLASLNIDYAPFYLRTLEELKAMLDYEAKISEQSEVIAAFAAQRGFKLAPLRRADARANGWPFYIPVAGADYNKEAVLKASKEVLAQNPDMGLLAAFIKGISAGEPLPPRI
ncbi:MAG: CpXC domain-containing protein [Elusimicrobiota bacterium]|jgi:hypothetical protein|nr:CpXC domain-containing protein [Elusimicrobiota bacterium]